MTDQAVVSAEGGGLLAGTSPSGRLLSALILVGSVAFLPALNPLVLGGCGLLLALAWAVSRPDARRFALRLVPALLASAALLFPLALAGQLAQATALFMRSGLAAAILITLTAALSANDLAPALSGLGLPAALSELCASALRQLGLAREEARRVRLARQLRGARGMGLGISVLAALLTRTARRAERVELAMRLSGYDPARRTRDNSALRALDLWLLGPALTAAVLLQWLAGRF